jgi:superfamily II DNA or RNA helicase
MILNIIVNLIKKEGRRVLMLSDRKSQLRWMYERVFTGNYGLMEQVGYYIGGMKENDLAISSKKSLVLGTYAMASEGMNVPELDTLILSSPKSDIVQSVGRILRKKQEDREKVPLVIDIIDPHDSLIRQSKKRETFYNGCEYDVKEGHWIGNEFVVKVNTKKRAPRKLKKGVSGVTNVGGCGGSGVDDDEAENVVCMITD